MEAGFGWERSVYITGVYNDANPYRRYDKNILNIFAVMLILAGGIFFLQGINILPGSTMTGHPQWAVNGGILIVAGIGLLLWANRRK